MSGIGMMERGDLLYLINTLYGLMRGEDVFWKQSAADIDRHLVANPILEATL
jgi:hypothetical protein